MRKFVTFALSALLVASIGVSLVGCGSSDRDENTILLWAGGQWTGSDAENLEEYVDWYNQTNTLGLTIDLEILTDFEQTFTSAMNVGNGPDLMVWDRFNTPYYASDEYLEPIDDLIARDGIDKSAYHTTAYEELSYEGVQYGLPLDLDTWGIFVNMDIINAYNEANPTAQITCFWQTDASGNYVLDANGNKIDKLDWTWDDLLSTAKKLMNFEYKVGGTTVKVKSGYDGKNVNEFFYHYYVSTGQSYIGENGLTDINNEYGQAVLDYLYQLYNETYSEGYIDERSFYQGQLAMYTRPTYFASALEKNAKSINARYMPQPKYPGEEGVNRGVLGGYGFAIPAPVRAKDRTDAWEAKKDRCWEFMKDWLYNETNMSKWAETSKTLPALLSTHSNPAVAENVILKDVAQFADVYVPRPVTPNWRNIQVNVFNSKIPQFCKGNSNTADTRSNYLTSITTESDKLLRQYM